MLYNYCAVDCACLFHKCKMNGSVADISAKMIDRIEREIRKHLEKDGKLFLLFDPIPQDDLQLDKSFTYIGIRKKILPDYKANRSYAPFYAAAMQTLRKYYAYRGPSVIEVYSDEYEADDYVAWIIDQANAEMFKSGSGPQAVALWSTDQDWARYLIDTSNTVVHLISGSFKKPYTRADFKKEFGFNPTAAANALYKGLFGDKSDNIVGAVFMKKAKFVIPIKTMGLEAVKYVSEKEWAQDRLKLEINKKINGNAEPDNPFDRLIVALRSAEPRLNAIDKLNNNLSAIFSLCQDPSKFATWNEEKTEMNSIMKAAINKEKTPFGKRFGRV